MSVTQEAGGRRSVQVEVEVPGSPDEVWQAVATGPGISSWFVPTTFEERDGEPVAVALTFGPGFVSRSEITHWDPPRAFTAQGQGWGGSPPIANAWTVTPTDHGTCVVRVKHSLSADTDAWDGHLAGTEAGWPGFFRTLRIVQAHFRGQPSAVMQLMAPAAGTEADAWARLMAAIGLEGVAAGDAWRSPAGVPPLGGVVEHLTREPFDALVRLEVPGPGVAAFGVFAMGGQAMVAINVYHYGEAAAATAARETPAWQAWLAATFPPPPAG